MGSLLDIEQESRLHDSQTAGGRKAAVFTLLASLNNRMPPLQLPAAFSVLPELEAAAQQADDATSGAASPTAPDYSEGLPRPLESILDHVKKAPEDRTEERIEELLKEKRGRKARTTRELHNFELRAAAQKDGTGGEDPAALAATMFLRLFDANDDGQISRDELLASHREKQKHEERGSKASELFKEKNEPIDTMRSKVTLNASRTTAAGATDNKRLLLGVEKRNEVEEH